MPHCCWQQVKPQGKIHAEGSRYRRIYPGPLDCPDVRAYLHYNDGSRNLILAFKHGDGLQLTLFLTSLMAWDFAMMTTGGKMPVGGWNRRGLGVGGGPSVATA